MFCEIVVLMCMLVLTAVDYVVVGLQCCVFASCIGGCLLSCATLVICFNVFLMLVVDFWGCVCLFCALCVCFGVGKCVFVACV